MRWLAVFTFLLGLVVGGLVGYGIADSDVHSRAISRSPEPVSGRLIDTSPRELHRDPQQAPPRQRSGAAAREVGVEGRGEPATVEDEGKGVLVVDPHRAGPNGVDNLSIACRDMRGGEASESLDERDDGSYRIEAFAGDYTLSWYEEDRTRSMGVRIRAGDTTVVRLPAATDPMPDVHVPAGFGRLDVRLVGADGEPVKYASARVIGRGISEWEEVKLDTESDGNAFVELLPGTYEVRIGCLRKVVVVREGEATRCVCDHAIAGEVRLSAGFPGRLALRAPRNIGEDETYAIHLWDWRHRTVAFVRPGTYTYALRMNGQSGQFWEAGTVNVEAGRLALIDPPVPTGSFELTVEVPKLPNVRPWSPNDARLLLAVDGEFTVAKVRLRATPTPTVFRGRVDRLPPGVWELRHDESGHIEIREKVSIGPGKTSRAIRLEPRR